MRRYYFDIREGLRFRPDHAGEEFEDLGSAKDHAVHLAGEIAKNTTRAEDDPLHNTLR